MPRQDSNLAGVSGSFSQLRRYMHNLMFHSHNSLFVAYRIRADLLARDYKDLIAMPPPVGNTPHSGSIRRPRVAV